MLPALDIHYGVAELERDAEVVQTLYYITLKAAGIRHQLSYDLYLRALQGHAARHYEADIARAEDDDLFAGHIALDVHQALSSTRREDACGTKAGDVERSAGAFAAAHSQDDGACLNREHTVLAVHRGDDPLRRDIHHHGVQLVFYAEIINLLDEAVGVLGAGQLLLEGVQAEAVVDALVEYAAQLAVALQDQHALASVLSRGNRGGKSRGASADYDYIILLHALSSFVRPMTIYESGPDLRISSMLSPSSRTRISMTFGLQKPA